MDRREYIEIVKVLRRLDSDRDIVRLRQIMGIGLDEGMVEKNDPHPTDNDNDISLLSPHTTTPILESSLHISTPYFNAKYRKIDRGYYTEFVDMTDYGAMLKEFHNEQRGKPLFDRDGRRVKSGDTVKIESVLGISKPEITTVSDDDGLLRTKDGGCLWIYSASQIKVINEY